MWKQLSTMQEGMFDSMSANKVLLMCRDIPAACNAWERVLVDYPNDLHALKFAHDCYFYLGDSTNIRDGIARVIKKCFMSLYNYTLSEQCRWTPDMPMYSHVKGMYAFGLEECNEFAEGERVGKEALSLNRNDAWATHAVAHVFEMQGRSSEGVRFMTSTLNDWEPCNYLACHNMWHWAVYHIDRKEYATALGIFEREVCIHS